MCRPPVDYLISRQRLEQEQGGNSERHRGLGKSAEVGFTVGIDVRSGLTGFGFRESCLSPSMDRHWMRQRRTILTRVKSSMTEFDDSETGKGTLLCRWMIDQVRMTRYRQGNAESRRSCRQYVNHARCRFNVLHDISERDHPGVGGFLKARNFGGKPRFCG